MSHQAYLARIPEFQRKILDEIRSNVLVTAPNAIESISSGVPAYTYNGKYLVSMTAAKDHVSFFMMRGDVLKKLKEELLKSLPTNTIVTNVAIKFNPESPIPADIIQRLVRLRMDEIDRNR